MENFQSLVLILVVGALLVLWLVVVLLNWVFLIPEDWGMTEGKDLWTDLKLAAMIALPVLNWVVLITTAYCWLYPEKKEAVNGN